MKGERKQTSNMRRGLNRSIKQDSKSENISDLHEYGSWMVSLSDARKYTENGKSRLLY